MKKLFGRLLAWLLGSRLTPGVATPVAAAPGAVEIGPPAKKRAKKFNWAAIAEVLAALNPPYKPNPNRPYQPMPGVVPQRQVKHVLKLAEDALPYGYFNQMNMDNYFKGYPYLAQLSQLPEYRNIVSTIAEEQTRKWIKVKGIDDSVKQDRISDMEELLKKYNVQAIFTKALEEDGFYGRSHIYIDVKTPGGTRAYDDPAELETLLALSDKKITKNCLIGFNLVEAMWSYPGVYNSTNPLAEDYYKPQSWYVMGKTVHESRLLTLVSNPVADILKAAYSFGGISLTQLAEPYVDNWIRTRNSVGDMIHSYSTNGLATNLAQIMAVAVGDADPSNIIMRARLFNETKDSRSLMLIDKDNEEFFQHNAPLAGLDKLQAQAQEHICSVSHIPLVKYTGLSPTGLNASSDGEIKVWYDWVAARNQRVVKPLLDTIFRIIQLSEWGEVDESLTYEFCKMDEPTPDQEAALAKQKSDTDKNYIDSGVLSQQDVRTVITNDPTSRYSGLDEERDEDEFDDEDEEDDAPAAAANAGGRKAASRKA